ncbi:Metallo-beta-lactamase superfamily protein [Limtongia smithiae]|uniref:Metallo-beta-lactamase superfamily protein n=1 Tax=Limtongia smithiae TaxID=1125753 RepID=UPI0034CFEE9C
MPFVCRCEPALHARPRRMALPYGTLPQGSKLWLLDLGDLSIDEGEVLSGSTVFPVSAPPVKHKRRELIMISALVLHPKRGLILYDTGTCEDVLTSWGSAALECMPRYWNKEKHSLPAAIAATGNDIKDVKIVVISHLHSDHAGGLEHFIDTDVEVWVHEDELKTAFWSAATGVDTMFNKDYLLIGGRLNWKTFSSEVFTLLPGITLHRCAGHTEGLVIFHLTLPAAGDVIFTADMFHVPENYYQGVPQGTLMRNFYAWKRSRSYIMTLVNNLEARVCFGHDKVCFSNFPLSPAYLE